MSIQALIESVESELENLLERLSEALPFEHEYRDDLVEYSLNSSAEQQDALRLRHREWFLLERVSEHLGAIPLERFQEGLDEGAIASSAHAYATLRGSRVGVFVVTRTVATDGLLLEDLLGRGNYAIPDGALALNTEVGDLVVGRVYPEDLTHDGERTNWGLSSAATLIRNPELVTALRRDLEAMHERSRGPLRMSQKDVEAMFFSEQLHVTEDSAASKPLDKDACEVEVRTLLGEAAIAPERITEYLAVIASYPLPESDTAVGGDDPLGWLLDELAFDSEVAIGRARQTLMKYWHACSSTETAAPPPSPEAETFDAEVALARFDQDRAAGKSLDDLFRALEADMGIEEEEDPENGGGGAPDFPGVLGVLVQEFLWDGARMGDLELVAFAEAHRELELFAQFGAFMGTAEELNSSHIELFLGRWIWEAGRLKRGGYKAENAVRATRDFCAWFSEHQTNVVAAELGQFLDGIAQDAARIQTLNEALQLEQYPEPSAFYEFVSAEEGRSRWLDQHGGTIDLPVDSISASLSSGDLVAGTLGSDSLSYQGFYPALASPYLIATS